MKRFAVALTIIQLLLSFGTIFAYEVRTHEQLSQKAVNMSVLTDSAFQSHLGLKPPEDLSQKFPNYKPEDGLRTVSQLVQDGAKYEDNDIRARGHFFNPLNGYALFNVPGFIPSPDWTLEDKRDISGQDDSFKDTRQFFFEALTLPSETDRKRQWGRTFQGLGQVIHHLQDMAQPEHSRVDAHLKYTPDGTPVNGPGEDPSRYEKYSGRKTNICTPLSLCAPYGPVQFDTARQFWVTKEAPGLDRGTGAGIAEFTNNNFVSKDTNFIDDALAPGLVEAKPGYPLPDGSGARIEVKEFQELGIPPIETSYPIMPSPLEGKLYFIGTPIRDAYTNSIGFNDRTSTFSIYEPDLKKYSLDVDCNPNNDPPTSCHTRAIFTLNNFNFDAAHQFLVKRAIGYSAGMINYFFRGVGQLDLAEDPTDPTRLLLQNLSDETLDGTFTLYYDDADGNRTPVPGAQWTASLPGHGEISVAHFPPPSTPAPKKPGEYLLVFKGTMGQETDIAVAATMLHPPAPESFLFDHQYSLTQDQTNQWVFAHEDDLQYGQVNWSGEAGVLTYDGLTAVTSETVTYGSAIYREGHVLAVAPAGYQVLAAALQPDPDNPPYPRLVAILSLPSGTSAPPAGSIWVKALAGTYREWHQQSDLDLSVGGGWRFNQAGTKACGVGSRTTSSSCTFTPKYFGSFEYQTYFCTSTSETYVTQVDLGSGSLTEHNVVSSSSISRSDNPNHLYQFYTGTYVTAADYRNNVLTVATSTSTSEDEHDGSVLKAVFPYWQHSSYSQTVAIDGTVQLSSSGTREENWRWLYTEGIWEGSGMEDWTESGFAALDLRGPWFVYTTSHRSGTATGGGPVTEAPGRWTIQSSSEFGTNREGMLSSGGLGDLMWALDRQGNVAFSLKLAETSTWLNRLNNQDLGTLTGLTGQIPEIGIR